jgi:hypothetical protein
MNFSFDKKIPQTPLRVRTNSSPSSNKNATNKDHFLNETL